MNLKRILAATTLAFALAACGQLSQGKAEAEGDAAEPAAEAAEAGGKPAEAAPSGKPAAPAQAPAGTAPDKPS